MAVELKNIKIGEQNVPVIFEKTSNPPLFSLQLVFAGLGSYNNGELHGIADILSSLLNEGSKKHGATGFAELLEKNALLLSVDNGLETLSFSLSGTSDKFELGIDLLAELLTAPNFSQKELDKVKQNSLMAILERENDFDYQSSRGLKAMLFSGTPLEFPAAGTKESIEKISLKDIKDKYKKGINLANLTIILGGNLDYDSSTKKIAEIIKDLPLGKKINFAPIFANNKKQEKSLKKDTKQAYIYFGSPLNVDKHNDAKELAKIRVASFVLGGGGFGSRMLEEVRVKRGLAYSAYMQLNATPTLSYANGHLQTSLENEKEALKVVREVLLEFLKNGITNEELKAAKSYLLGSEPLRNETLNQRISTAFLNYYRGLPLDFNSKILKEIESLNLNEINSYIKSHKEIADLSVFIVKK